jgi:hypothetical protein
MLEEGQHPVVESIRLLGKYGHAPDGTLLSAVRFMRKAPANPPLS